MRHTSHETQKFVDECKRYGKELEEWIDKCIEHISEFVNKRGGLIVTINGNCDSIIAPRWCKSSDDVTAVAVIDNDLMVTVSRNVDKKMKKEDILKNADWEYVDSNSDIITVRMVEELMDFLWEYVEAEDDDDDEDYGEKRQHRIIDTKYGEVMVKCAFDADKSEKFCDCYIGDNFDKYIGEVYCDYYDDDDETIAHAIESEIDHDEIR